MKRIVLLLSFLVAVALCAGAQMMYVDFHEMPIARAPVPMPDNYPLEAGLYWDNLYYVSPGTWSGEGPGFWVDPSTRHNTVAFMGGPQCNLATPCHGSIKLQVAPNATATFAPVSMSVSAGWMPNKVIVTAYNKGQFVGQMVWRLTTRPQVFSFPATWKVTQLVFIPEVIPLHSIYPKPGSMVIYSFVMMKH